MKEIRFSLKIFIIIFISVAGPHKFSSGSRVPKMSMWIRIQGGKH